MPDYLRVKNWRDHQHYRDRRPPWIKLMRDLIDGDNGRPFRELLNEQEQWQLVRLWLYASGSDMATVDPDGHEVPVIPFDEPTLRIGIRSIKRLPIAKFVSLGFLVPVASTDASASASTGASADASALASAGANAREPEVPENSEKAKPKNTPKPPTPNGVGLALVLPHKPSLTKVEGRDLSFDAIAVECAVGEHSPRGREVATALNGSRGQPGIRELYWLEYGGQHGEAFERMLAAEVRERCGLYRRKMNGAALTPRALWKWWVDMPAMPALGGDAATGADAVLAHAMNLRKQELA